MRVLCAAMVAAIGLAGQAHADAMPDLIRGYAMGAECGQAIATPELAACVAHLASDNAATTGEPFALGLELRAWTQYADSVTACYRSGCGDRLAGYQSAARAAFDHMWPRWRRAHLSDLRVVVAVFGQSADRLGAWDAYRARFERTS